MHWKCKNEIQYSKLSYDFEVLRLCYIFSDLNMCLGSNMRHPFVTYNLYRSGVSNSKLYTGHIKVLGGPYVAQAWSKARWPITPVGSISINNTYSTLENATSNLSLILPSTRLLDWWISRQNNPQTNTIYFSFSILVWDFRGYQMTGPSLVEQLPIKSKQENLYEGQVPPSCALWFDNSRT